MLHTVFMGIVLSFIVSAQAAPGGNIGGEPLFTLNNGNVGVNFLGFKASAGLGGLLNGNAAGGGLHAEAGTPFGQYAGAGLGGRLEGAGRSSGGLYAGATAGGGISAGAGLEGSTGVDGSYGASYSGASAGGAYKSKTVEVAQPVVFHKHVEISSPAVHKQVVHEVVHEEKPQTTYVQKTVIPNYVEKTIQVPSYVEKTVKVPTFVEKKIKVPAAPTIIEKTVAAPPENVNFDTSVYEEVVHPQATTFYKHGHQAHPHNLHFRKQFNFLGGGGLGGGGGYAGGFGGGYTGGYGGGAGGDYGGSSSVTLTKSVNPNLINDIFNIPIQTLGAVGKLVNGITQGASGSLSVSKSFGGSASTY